MTTTSETSGYLHYLPPALWAGTPPTGELSLGGMLRIFEKLLSGIDDDEVVSHRPPDPDGKAHRHDGIEAVIARLHELFDPWRTPVRFLGWLAGWVGLELQSGWDEHQRRKAIAEIVRINTLRGGVEGLNRYFDLYTAATNRPRITVDSSAKVLFAAPVPGQPVPVHTLVSQGPFVRPDKRTIAYSGLVIPQCIAVTPDHDLIVGDTGMPAGQAGASPPVRAGVWRITRAGAYADVKGASPRPLGKADWPPEMPVALAIEQVQGRAPSWNLYVLDVNLALYRLGKSSAEAQPVRTEHPLQLSAPVGMAFDRGHLLLLDRGTSGTGAVVDVDLSVTPAALTRHALPEVMTPRSLLVAHDGALIIGDAREDEREQALPTPADLVRIDRSDPAAWRGRRLLAGLPAEDNPLVAPVALVQEREDRLLVLDVGLKPDPDRVFPFLRQVTNPATVHRVDLGNGVPTVTRATEAGRLVYPKGMVLDAGTLYICDGGEPNFTAHGRDFRSADHEFGVVVHFSRQSTVQEQRAIVHGIGEILDRERPAGSLHEVITKVGGVDA